MPRVVLVNLPFQRRIARVAQTSVGPPMGLAYVAAVLRRSGHDVAIVDGNALGLDRRRLVDRIARLQPDVVGTTAATPSLHLACDLARAVRERLPGSRFVLGGPHGTALPEDTLAGCDGLDAVVVGEGEPIADRLVRALCGDGDLASVPSIASRLGDRVALNPPLPPDTDLDSLPLPARDLLPNRLYRTIDAWPMTCMIAMRGCPAGCSYCSVPALAGRVMRRRSETAVVAEMEQVARNFGVRHVAFLDDTFTTSREWVERFCELSRAAGLPGRLSWSCLTRPDLVDDDLLAAMKAAGLRRVEFGIESGSAPVLRDLGKGVRLETIRAAFAAARRQGLVTLGFAMIGGPHETRTEIEATEREVLALDPDFLQLAFCTPYPGTRLHERCLREGLLATRDWSRYVFLRNPLILNEHLSPADLRRAQARILRRFYLRPRKMAALLRYASTDPGVARSLARTSAAAAWQLISAR